MNAHEGQVERHNVNSFRGKSRALPTFGRKVREKGPSTVLITN